MPAFFCGDRYNRLNNWGTNVFVESLNRYIHIISE